MKKGISLLLILPLLAFSLTTQQSASLLIKKARDALQTRSYINALTLADQAFRAATEEEFKAEALYWHGWIAEKAAEDLEKTWSTKKVKLITPGVITNEDLMNFEGLKPYRDIGIDFKIGHYVLYYYDGDSYQRIVRDLPKTSWACAASFRLFLIAQIRAGGEWEGDVSEALKDLEIVERYYGECNNPEVRRHILHRLAFDHYYCVQCYWDSTGWTFDIEKGRFHYDKAQELYRIIFREFPNTEVAERAKWEIHALESLKKRIKISGKSRSQT